MNQETPTSHISAEDHAEGSGALSPDADSSSSYFGNQPVLVSSSLSLNAGSSMEPAISTTVLGYDFEFVPTVDAKYICPICMLVLRNPVQTECGHRFCANCLRRWLSQNTGETEAECPNCKDRITSNQIFPDNFAKREIMNLSLRCPNAKNGCDTTTDLHHVQSHIDSVCQYALCPCPNNCSDILLRKDLKHHVTVTCPKLWTTCSMCLEKISSGSYQSHLHSCHMSMDICNYCGTKFLKNKLKQHHETDCPQFTVPCMFLPFGCQHKCIRELLSRHVETSLSEHLGMVSKTVITLLQQINSMTPASVAKVYEFQQAFRSHRIDSGQSHALGTKSESQELCDFMTDPGFESSLSSPQLDPALSRNRGLFAGSLRVVPAVEGSYESPEITSGDSAFESKASGESRTSTDDSKHTVTLLELRQNVLVLQQVFAQQAKRFLKLESLPEEIAARHCNGLYLWRIDNVERYRQSAKSGAAVALHSQGFYTSLYGYKICIRVNLNGIEKGSNKFIALFVHLMKGDYDEILDWPFNGNITLSILDQEKSADGVRKDYTESLEANPNLTAFAKPTTSRNHKGFGYIEFAPLSILDNQRYVKNSVLFIRATVRVLETVTPT